MEKKQTVFDFQAEVGLTKHLGGLGATEELIELCHIGEGKHVLDVGCGVGVTPCFIAKRYGCRVVGVDISEGMIERSKERAKREGVADRVEFRLADAQDLPFEDDLFDAVFTESVTALPEDKQRAVNEYVRVTKPGGYVGLNEGTWIKTPPPTELAEYLSGTFGVKGRLLTSDEWEELLASAGLRDLLVRTHKVNTLSTGREGVRDAVRVGHRVLYMYIRKPAFRRFIRETLSLPKNLFDYFGYGIYVGRK